MSPTETVITKILDLDDRAENVRSQAREKARSFEKEAAAAIDEEKKKLERDIAEKTAGIKAEAERKRTSEVEAVRAEYAAKAGAIRNMPESNIAGGVDMILTRLRGVSR